MGVLWSSVSPSCQVPAPERQQVLPQSNVGEGEPLTPTVLSLRRKNGQTEMGGLGLLSLAPKDTPLPTLLWLPSWVFCVFFLFPIYRHHFFFTGSA